MMSLVLNNRALVLIEVGKETSDDRTLSVTEIFNGEANKKSH